MVPETPLTADIANAFESVPPSIVDAIESVPTLNSEAAESNAF